MRRQILKWNIFVHIGERNLRTCGTTETRPEFKYKEVTRSITARGSNREIIEREARERGVRSAEN